MKLSHLCIIFLIIILPFSILSRNTTREYMLTLRDQVRLNNVIDTATQDALSMLIELNDEFQSMYFQEKFNVTQVVAEEAVKSFFQTLAVNFNMPYIEGSTESYFSVYVPAIVVVAYDGFFVFSINETGGTYAYEMSPKIPYAYEQDGVIINFTLGNDLKIYIADQLYEGTLTANYADDIEGTYEQYEGAFGGSSTLLLKYLPDLTNDMSLVLMAVSQAGYTIPNFLKLPTSATEIKMLQDYSRASGDAEASLFHQKRREVIIGLIREVLQEEINSHTSYAKMFGSSYDFSLPEISNDDWTNSIDDISIMSFIQGVPVGINKYYNNYALGASRIIETDYIYGQTVDPSITSPRKYYHRDSCEAVVEYLGGTDNGMDNLFLNRNDAAKAGYYPCGKCSP